MSTTRNPYRRVASLTVGQHSIGVLSDLYTCLAVIATRITRNLRVTTPQQRSSPGDSANWFRVECIVLSAG